MRPQTARLLAATLLVSAIAGTGIFAGYFAATNTLEQALTCMENCE